MKKVTFLKKAGCLLLAGVISSQVFCSACSLAASKNWSLSATDGPRSEWVTERIVKFTTKKSTTTVNCSRLGRETVVHVDTSNEIHGHLTSTGSVLQQRGVPVGQAERATFTYEAVGITPNSPSGQIDF